MMINAGASVSTSEATRQIHITAEGRLISSRVNMFGVYGRSRFIYGSRVSDHRLPLVKSLACSES